MKNLYSHLIIGFALVILFSACKEETINTAPGKFGIYSIQPKDIYPGNEILIYGDEFGAPNDSSFVMFDTVAVKSTSCITWNNSLIKVTAPGNMTSCKVCVVKYKKDTSNILTIKIKLLPPFELVEIQPGTFVMGSDGGLDNEAPAHQVRIPNSFLILKTEVTNELWNAVLKSNPAKFSDYNIPVNNITWYEAVYFCNQFSKISGLDTCYIIKGDTVTWLQNAKGYRLPTEAEWEYACRAGLVGDMSDTVNIEEMAWLITNSGGKPHPVGTKKPNAFGLYDMFGNVNEWCWDWYSSDYYKTSPSDYPAGPDEGAVRVMRGGSWSDTKLFVRSSCRTFPENTTEYTGLRVVRNK